MFTLPILSMLIILPLFGAFIISIIQGKEENTNNNIKYITILIMVMYLVITIYLLLNFDKVGSTLQFVDKINLLQIINFSYFVGLDGLGLVFLFILAISFTIMFIFIEFPVHNIKTYTISFLIILSGATGLFVAQDIILFFMFYEVSILPIYILIGLFGNDKKDITNIKFIIYNICSAMLLLICIIYMISITKDSSITSIVEYSYSINHSYWLFILLFLSFAIKSALVPFNTWLPLTYVNSSIGLNIILTAVIAKYGIFGIIKILIPALPELSKEYNYLIYLITSISVFYAIIIAIKSDDLKKLIAYMSISHVALLIAVPFSANLYAIEGAIMQSLSHALYNIGLFLIVFILNNRFHTNSLTNINGLANSMPKFAFFIVIIGLSVMSFPLTSTFISEILMLLGIFLEYRVYGLIFTISILFNAAIVVLIYKKLVFFPNSKNSIIVEDINNKEILGLSIITFLIILLGIYPHILLDIIQNYSVIWTEALKPSIPNFIENINN